MSKVKRARIMHCKLCGKASPSSCKDFKSQMAWLRRHRKLKHPTAHKKSVKKTVATKKKGNPASLKDAIGHAVSPYYLYQRRVKKKSPKEAEAATIEAAKKAIGGLK